MPNVLISTFNPGTAFGSDVAQLQTSDGVSMVSLWNEVVVPALNDYNTVKESVVDFFGFRSDKMIDQVVQTVGRKWLRGGNEVVRGVGGAQIRRWLIRTASIDYKSYSGYTRKYIQENTSTIIVGELNAMLKALTDQKFIEVLTAIFSGGNRTVVDAATGESLVIQGLVSGEGNMPIPPVGTNTFTAATHNHYLFEDFASDHPWKTSLDSRLASIKALIRTVTEHKYRENIVLVCQGDVLDDIETMPGFRHFRSVSPLGQTEAAALSLVDPQATILDFKNLSTILRVKGTIENATVIESEMMPLGSIMCFSFAGMGNENNPVQWMEKPIATFSDNPYPFYETMYETAFGASIRKRLNGAVLYLASGATAYVAPTITTAGAMVGDWDGQ